MNNEAGGMDAERVRQIIATNEIKTVRVTFVDNSGVTRARNVTPGMLLSLHQYTVAEISWPRMSAAGHRSVQGNACKGMPSPQAGSPRSRRRPYKPL